MRGGCDLSWRCWSSAAYTTTLGLTHLFPITAHRGAWLATCSAIRMCGSAYTVTRVSLRPSTGPLDRPEPFGRDRAAMRSVNCSSAGCYNSMLNKWLEYCLELGHSLAIRVTLRAR